MSDHDIRLSDEAIERGLVYRAPHDADPALMGSILSAALRTRQSRSWMPTALAPDASRGGLAWIAIILVLVLVIAALAVIGGGTPPPNLVVVESTASPRPSDSLVDPLSSIAPTPGPCVTDQVEVLAGDALPATEGDTLTDLGEGRGVYVAGNAPRLWAAGPGPGPARLIASITPELGVLDVLDISADGSSALIRAGDVSPSGLIPECADLYLARTDGSGASRLTTFGAAQFVAGAAFSPDGRRVAYSSWEPGTLTVLDLATNQTVDQACDVEYSTTPVSVDWSPSGDAIAASCGRDLTVFDPRAATEAISFSADEIVAADWAPDGDLLMARAPGSVGTGLVRVDAVDVASGATTRLASLGGLAGLSIETGSIPIGFSPDGRWLIVRGREQGTPYPAGDYLLPVSGGPATRLEFELRGDGPVSWSADSRALVYVDQEQTLVRLDVQTGKRSTLGTLRDYRNGVWRLQ